ncbi:NuA4 histone acetyltransferase subunit [Malassezia psittaci]|uniref:NuA4 histone acetyltransferase subunit n=1 Tax=Malassezia psittaci TaxID=1821823 RepID=A0AAF0F7H8_9BASI|nr:NuA4 histone acetyltransferase subunit [Malassezia psittaci]
MPGVYGGDEINAIVLDPGTSVFRAGWAGEDQPRVLFPSHYGWLPMSEEDRARAAQIKTKKDAGAGDQDKTTEDHGDVSMTEASDANLRDSSSDARLPRGMSYDLQKDRKRYVGDAGVTYWRPGMEIDTPFDADGIVQDVSSLEALAEHAMDTMTVDARENPLLCTEPSTNPAEVRAKMAELAFEGLQVPAFYLANRTVLSSFASGRPTSMVVDIGASQVSAIPVVDGFVLRKGIHTQPNGGDAVSRALLWSLTHEQSQDKNMHGWLSDSLVPQYLVRSKKPVDPGMPPQATLREDRLQHSAPSFRAYHTMRLLDDFKEAMCQTLETPWDPAHAAARPTRMYEFPDGYNDAYGPMRFKAPEAILTPSLYASSSEVLPSGPTEYRGLTDLILEATKAVDVDSRAAMFSNIVCVGGGTLLPGLIDRLSYELSVAAPSQRIKIHAPGNYTERRHSTWLGGSILASLGTFHQLWISKQEYEEHGSAIVQARCK